MPYRSAWALLKVMAGMSAPAVVEESSARMLSSMEAGEEGSMSPFSWGG